MKRGLPGTILAAALVLSGCGANSDQGRYVNLVWRLVSGNRMEVTREQAGGIPFASIGVAIGSADDEHRLVLQQSGELLGGQVSSPFIQCDHTRTLWNRQALDRRALDFVSPGHALRVFGARPLRPIGEPTA